MSNPEHVSTETRHSTNALREHTTTAVIVGGATFLACMFGIYTRPTGLLAAIWPANAILLGLFVINPRLATPFGYFGATLGFFAADLYTGASLLKTFLLTSANLAGVVTGHLLFTLIPAEDRRLKRPFSVLYLFLISLAAAAVSALFGAIANPILFNGPLFSGWAFWFGTELVNYVAVLPVVLCLPNIDFARLRAAWIRGERRADYRTIKLTQIAPAAALLLSGIAAHVIGGPGAVAFPIPALLWCAIAYHQWIASVLMLIFTSWILLVITMDHVGAAIDLQSKEVLLSIRFGVALATLGPIMVASMMAARGDLVSKLERMASHDHMTGLLNRRAFRELGTTNLRQMQNSGSPVALLMLDLDHFKRINDTYGHAGGDQVLVSFAATLSGFLRIEDVVARVGGEEFVVMLPNSRPNEAMIVAERIRSTFAQASILLARGERVNATVSIGVACAERAPLDVDRLFEQADAALYTAKGKGRNRIEIVSFQDAA